jgi:HAE1 family hydrophobic/amphiphilic exporter-1
MVRLKDVARVELGALNYQQTGRIDGQPGCAIGIFQMPGSNALTSPTPSNRRWRSCRARFPADVKYAFPIDTTLAVTQGIREILITLSEALLLVIFVVYLFLQNWRATLIPMAAVPGLVDRHLHLLSRPSASRSTRSPCSASSSRSAWS